MIDLITDTGVLASIAIALALCLPAAALGAIAGGRFRPPAFLVWLPAILAAAAIDLGIGTEHLEPSEPIAWTVSILLVSIMAAVAVSATSVGSVGRRLGIGLVVAGAAVGILLCVPETDALRLLPAPLGIAAIAAVLGAVRPFGLVDVTLAGSGLAWLSLVGGQPRPASIVGAGACLAAVALLPVAWRWSPQSRNASTGRPTTVADRLASVSPGPGRLTVIGLAVLACSRLAGTGDSVGFAFAIAAAVLIAAVAILRFLPMEGSNDREPGTADEVEPITHRARGGQS